MDTLQIGFLWYGITSRNEKSRKNNAFYAALLPFDNLIADRTGLEPATSAVTGRHSNQLNYRSLRASRTNFSFQFVCFGVQI